MRDIISRGIRGGRGEREVVGIVWASAIALAASSIAVATVLLYFYSRSFRNRFSKIALGHFMFAVFIIAQSVIALLSYINLASRFGPEVGFPALLISLTGLLALGFLFWSIWQ